MTFGKYWNFIQPRVARHKGWQKYKIITHSFFLRVWWYCLSTHRENLKVFRRNTSHLLKRKYGGWKRQIRIVCYMKSHSVKRLQLDSAFYLTLTLTNIASKVPTKNISPYFARLLISMQRLTNWQYCTKSEFGVNSMKVTDSDRLIIKHYYY